MVDSEKVVERPMSQQMVAAFYIFHREDMACRRSGRSGGGWEAWGGTTTPSLSEMRLAREAYMASAPFVGSRRLILMQPASDNHRLSIFIGIGPEGRPVRTLYSFRLGHTLTGEMIDAFAGISAA
jgi:hypothetical protein